MKKCILWLRKDLRLKDHPGFAHAIQQGYQILPMFIWDKGEHRWQDGPASQWGLHHALADLQDQIHQLGGNPIIHKLTSKRDKWNFSVHLIEILSQHGADAIYMGRR